MSKLIIHKSLTPKTLFRVTGGSIYNRPGWDIATNKQELVAYFTQFQPEIISIGNIDGMSTMEVAQYVKSIYDLARARYPRVLVIDETLLDNVNQLFQVR